MDPGVTPTWLAYHLYYHGDRDRLLVELVRPTVADMFARAQIETFFFVRYALHGPHIRLRLRARQGAAGAVHESVTNAAARFFARSPSRATFPDHVIRTTSEQLRSAETDDCNTEGYADNTCVTVEPYFEVARYGGAGTFGHALDYFAVSSVHALEVCSSGTTSRLAAALRSFVWQAWGFARDGTEFAAIIEYTRTYWEDLWRAAAQDADAFFDRRSNRIRHLLRSELEGVAAHGDDEDIPTLGILAEGAQVVAAHLPAEYEPRLSIAMSHLHMTANRLGLANVDEAYVSRVLWRAVQEAATPSETWWKELWQVPRRTPRADLPTLRSDSCALLYSPSPHA